MMPMLLDAALSRASKSPIVFAKLLSANDTGLTGGHQCGIYIQKQNVPLIFDALFAKGENHERKARMIWNDGEWDHESNFKYYGRGTRNEYRITGFGRGFPFLKPENTGDLVVICTDESKSTYHAYLLSRDEEMESFLDAFSISPTELNSLIKQPKRQQRRLEEIIESYVLQFGEEFPSTTTMSQSAEEIDEALNDDLASSFADEIIVRRIDTEYKLFRRMEDVHYAFVTLKPAESLEEYVRVGLEITNRRKSRAGKSLEHHLATLFKERGLAFEEQVRTEGSKRPDFIFPSGRAYHDPSFPNEKLVFLGAKTTCKDRWRQILNEANRIEKKYLFTLQQGVSPNQLEEMKEEEVVLVVPKQYHRHFPATAGKNLISLEEFIEIVRSTQ